MTACCTKENLPGKTRAAASLPPQDWSSARLEPTYGSFRRIFQAVLFLSFATLWLAALAIPIGAEPLRVVAFGDSLTAGAGLQANEAFPSGLETRLRADGYDVRVVNAGVSGDTTTGGAARIAFALQDGADLVILELGANDMMLGHDLKAIRDDLEQIIAYSEMKGARVVLAGMVANANFGADYERAFDRIYPDLAKEHSLPLYPFFMEGVAGDRNFTLPDGVHPNAAGVRRIVSGVAPTVEKALDAILAARKTSAAPR